MEQEVDLILSTRVIPFSGCCDSKVQVYVDIEQCRSACTLWAVAVL